MNPARPSPFGEHELRSLHLETRRAGGVDIPRRISMPEVSAPSLRRGLGRTEQPQRHAVAVQTHRDEAAAARRYPRALTPGASV